MASKRKSTSGTSTFNFRPPTESAKCETKGTRPVSSPLSIQEALLTMVIHVCRSVLFVNTYKKVGLYMAGIFLSIIFDKVAVPKTYFSRSDNLFNLYFVKLGWGWTLILTVPFVFLTSFVITCGKRKLILMHLSRLGVATAVWFVFTKSFAFIEQTYGTCSIKGEKSGNKQACISKGGYWYSLDISGHTFILIWSCLVIIEEARVILGWETIKDTIRNAEYSRSTSEIDFSSPVRHLSEEEFEILKSSYSKFSPYIRALFISMTLLTIIWDIMIASTCLYFHTMIEKLISGVLAISIWFITYRFWYANIPYPPKLPGDGLFKYNKTKAGGPAREPSFRSRSSLNKKSNQRDKDLPKFMGMPLYGLRTQETKEEDDNFDNDLIPNKSNSNTDGKSYSYPRQGVVTRSQASNLTRNAVNKTI